MDTERAVYWLRRYLREESYKPTKRLFGWRVNYEFMRASYERSLVRELISRMETRGDDPIRTVQDCYYAMDDIVCNSERPQSWAFAGIMENCCADILQYLRKHDT